VERGRKMAPVKCPNSRRRFTRGLTSHSETVSCAPSSREGGDVFLAGGGAYQLRRFRPWEIQYYENTIEACPRIYVD
jgi:hypothetical protein